MVTPRAIIYVSNKRTLFNSEISKTIHFKQRKSEMTSENNIMNLNALLQIMLKKGINNSDFFSLKYIKDVWIVSTLSCCKI